jgi:hypothetical protein
MDGAKAHVKAWDEIEKFAASSSGLSNSQSVFGSH